MADNIVKLYKFLLNRYPIRSEFINKPLNLINKDILNSNEYKNFIEDIKNIIRKIYCKLFNLNQNQIQLNEIDTYKTIQFYRINNYDSVKLNIKMKEKQIESIKKIDELINFLFPEKDEKKKKLNKFKFESLKKNLYIDLIKNNFNFIETEFNLIHNNFYLDYIKKNNNYVI